MVYGDFKYLTRRTAFHKIFHEKAFSFAKDPKYDGYQRGLTSMVYKFLDKKTSGETGKNQNISNKKLAEELHKPIINKFKKRIVQTFYRQYLRCWSCWCAFNKQNKGIRFLLCVIDIQ